MRAGVRCSAPRRVKVDGFDAEVAALFGGHMAARQVGGAAM
jgi:hypothetical protein